MSKQENPYMFSVGRNGTVVFENEGTGSMVNDYKDEEFEKVYYDCMAKLADIKDDDAACIKRLFDMEKERRNKEKSCGYIMPQKETGTGDYFEVNQQQRLKKNCSTIRQLCRNNFFENNAVHVTLTFDSKKSTENFKDLKTAKKAFSDFIKRMNYHYDNFHHVTVFARQENGNWHFHMLCNLMSNTRQDQIEKIWKKGQVRLEYKYDKESFDNTIGYLCYNLRENFFELVGIRAVLYTRGLQKNLKLASWKQEENVIINVFSQITEATKANVREIGKDTENYYIKMTIPDYWKPIVMATPKEKKFKHKKYRVPKKKGGKSNVKENKEKK